MKLSKIMSLFLAFVMLFSAVPMMVFAEEELDIDDYVAHYPSKDEPYVELYEDYTEGATYQWSLFGVDIEGETDSALKCEIAFCQQYVCTVVLSDSTTFEVGFSTMPEIEYNVSEYNYSFDVTDTDKLEGYQWYSHITNDIAVTDENASNICSSCETSVYSSYDEETNLWSGAVIGGDGAGLHEIFYFEVELKEGDMLLIDVGPEVEEIVIADSDYDFVDSPSYSLVGNIGVFTAEADETYKITIYSPNRNSKLSAYIRSFEQDVLLEGETDNEPSAPILGNYYYCIATYENGFTLTSNTFLVMPEIYDEPDAVFPEFFVSHSNYAKFQWYRIDQTAIPITAGKAWVTDGTAGAFSSYDSENDVWYGVEYYSVDDGYREISFFETMFDEGDVIKFETDANVEYDEIYLYRSENDTGEWYYCSMEDGEYIFTVDVSGVYRVCFATYDEGDLTLSASIITEEIVTLEGENDSVLKNYERGETYYCEASYPACMVLASERVTLTPQIIEQPTAESPEVRVTFEEQAEFQWYTATPYTKIVDDTMVDYAKGSFDSETGEWTPDYGEPYEYAGYLEYNMRLFYIELKAGESLKVTISNPDAISPEDPNMRFYGYEDSYSSEWDENGCVYFTAEEDDIYEVYQYGFYPETATFKVEKTAYNYEEIEGENESKLSATERDVLYAVMVSYEDGTVLKSVVFEVVPVITKQPTMGNMSVDVNIKEDDMEYQWYEVIVDTTVITDEDVTLTNEDDPATYDSETQQWTPTIYDYREYDGEIIYELDLFIMALNEGETVTFVPSEELYYDEITIMQSTGNDLYIHPNEDGSYTFVAPKTQEYYFYTYDDNAEVSFKATKVGFALGDAIEGETDAKLKNYKEGAYVCAITYADGTELVSDIAIIKGLGDINADGAVDSLDYLLIKRACFKTYELDDYESAVADINGDGEINSADYLLVKRIAFGTYTA